jgi:hypothetical protein
MYMNLTADRGHQLTAASQPADPGDDARASLGLHSSLPASGGMPRSRNWWSAGPARLTMSLKPVTCSSPVVHAHRGRGMCCYTMLTNFLGFESSQLGKIPQNVVAANAARVDRARAVGFHCPSIVSGVYSSSGRLGGSQLALVPIDVDIGRIQVYTTKVPIRLVARTAGSKLQRILFYLSDEEGGKIEMQGERFDATVVLEW